MLLWAGGEKSCGEEGNYGWASRRGEEWAPGHRRGVTPSDLHLAR